jgi:Flp pilus assembly protein TadB
MKDFKREFSFSKDSCEHREINDESRRESQVDVFIVVILFFRIVFSSNHLTVFVVFIFVALVFVVLVSVLVAFFLRAKM